MDISLISEQGRRSEMEDTHVIKRNIAGKGNLFGGVYDGHCGKFAANYASEKLHERFRYRVNRIPIDQAYIESYKKISSELKQKDPYYSGTCAANFFIKDGKIFTANVGDARVIVVGREKVHQLTIDHRVDNKEERDRILRMGGFIYKERYACRSSGDGLMPTRTLGDDRYEDIGIISIPYTNTYKIMKDDIMLIAACDGLFDEMTNKEVAKFVYMLPVSSNPFVEVLKDEVLYNRNGIDNLTIIAVVF